MQFGGLTPGGALNDLWALELNASPPRWVKLGADGLGSSRAFHACAYDETRDQFIVFGGANDDDTENETISVLDLATAEIWEDIVSEVPSEVGRTRGNMFFDADSDSLILAGGYSTHADGPTGVWKFMRAPEAWEFIADRPDVELENASLTFDRVEKRLLLYDGSAGSQISVLSTETPGATWGRIRTRGAFPVNRLRAVAIFDPDGPGMYLIGGIPFDETENDWYLTLTNEATWRGLTPDLSSPRLNFPVSTFGADGTERVWLDVPASVFVRSRNELLIVPASDLADFGDSKVHLWRAFVDTPTLRWERLETISSPPPRAGHALVFDEAADRVILFGGIGLDATVLSDLWVLELTNHEWSYLGSIPEAARWGHSAVLEGENTMLVFGGFDAASKYVDDTLVLSLTDLSALPLVVAGERPPNRAGSSVAFLRDRNLAALYGGHGESGDLGDLWSLNFNNTPPQWRILDDSSPPGPASGHKVAVSVSDNALLLLLPLHRSLGATSRVARDSEDSELWQFSWDDFAWRPSFSSNLRPRIFSGFILESISDDQSIVVTTQGAWAFRTISCDERK